MLSPIRPTGYLHGEYARSYADWGTPLHLKGCGGWLVRRAIPGSDRHDAMGCYPLFCCLNWESLREDVAQLDNELVSIVLVTDPTAEFEATGLQSTFGHVRPYRDHFLVETGSPPREWVNPSHRRHALRALREVQVEVCSRPLDYREEWLRLYAVLSERHAITGRRRLSDATLVHQLAVPGLVMFRATVGGCTVGLDLWYVQGEVAHGHLAAFDAEGYRLRASYATKWFLLNWFQDRVRWINLGAGRSVDRTDGLSQFKGGFANATRPSWLCGRVSNRLAYTRLSGQTAGPLTEYFPFYRRGELASDSAPPRRSASSTAR